MRRPLVHPVAFLVLCGASLIGACGGGGASHEKTTEAGGCSDADACAPGQVFCGGCNGGGFWVTCNGGIDSCCPEFYCQPGSNEGGSDAGHDSAPDGASDSASAESGSCVHIDASSFDTSCHADSDCIAINVGTFCSGYGCTCPSGAINLDGRTSYDALFSSVSPGPNVCQCPRTGVVRCLQGQCVDCLFDVSNNPPGCGTCTYGNATHPPGCTDGGSESGTDASDAASE